MTGIKITWYLVSLDATDGFHFLGKSRFLSCSDWWELRLTSSMNQSGAY